jgi:hypothetical protein
MSIERAISRARDERRRAGARARRIVAALLGLFVAICVWGWATWIRMPGTSHVGPFEPLSERERALEAALRHDVEALAGTIGERSTQAPAGLSAAADLIERSLVEAGYEVKRQPYEVDGQTCQNLEAELPGGREKGVVIVGAHYDSVRGTVGADDNGSGVAGLLALARVFARRHPARTLRFVAFANEEPPYFQRPSMGSVVYAKRCRARGEDVVAMLSLETIGFYTDRQGSQRYPFPLGFFYPTAGDFVAFVGDTRSGPLVRRALATFRHNARFPSEGAAAPGGVPGVGWSDQWSFWREGYPAVMVTDTAPFRYPHYHKDTDTPDKLTYAPMARVVGGLERVVEELAGAAP